MVAQDLARGVDQRGLLGACGAGKVCVDRRHAQPIRLVDQLGVGLGREVQHTIQIDIGVMLDVVVGDRRHRTASSAA
jgi:hypothetical protein